MASWWNIWKLQLTFKASAVHPQLNFLANHPPPPTISRNFLLLTNQILCWPANPQSSPAPSFYQYVVQIPPLRTSLLVQWTSILLPMQGAWIWSLVWENPTCQRATNPLCHNYWACALEPVFCSKRCSHNDRITYWKEEWSPPAAIRKSPHTARRPSTTIYKKRKQRIKNKNQTKKIPPPGMPSLPPQPEVTPLSELLRSRKDCRVQEGELREG